MRRHQPVAQLGQRRPRRHIHFPVLRRPAALHNRLHPLFPPFLGPPRHHRVRARLRQEVDRLRGEIATLMQAAVQVGSEAISQAQDEVVISGERNLLAVTDFSSDMNQLRRAFGLFEQKAQLIRLLDVSSQAEGVRIFIGGESQIVPVEDLSVVSAPYEVDGQVVGTLGVIGPTRMPYERMIQIVDITARLVSNALSQSK